MIFLHLAAIWNLGIRLFTITKIWPTSIANCSGHKPHLTLTSAKHTPSPLEKIVPMHPEVFPLAESLPSQPFWKIDLVEQNGLHKDLTPTLLLRRADDKATEALVEAVDQAAAHVKELSMKTATTPAVPAPLGATGGPSAPMSLAESSSSSKPESSSLSPSPSMQSSSKPSSSSISWSQSPSVSLPVVALKEDNIKADEQMDTGEDDEIQEIGRVNNHEVIEVARVQKSTVRVKIEKKQKAKKDEKKKEEQKKDDAIIDVENEADENVSLENVNVDKLLED